MVSAKCRARRRRTCRRRSRTDAGARYLGRALASAPTSASTAPIGAILFDEKIGGTVHLAIGRSYPETGGTNESRRALGHDLRPAPGRNAVGRRRAAGRRRCLSHLAGRLHPFRAARRRATIEHMRRLLVLASVLAGCGGAATAPAPELRKVDDFPLYELSDHSPRRRRCSRKVDSYGLGVHGVLRHGRRADHGPQLRLPRRTGARAAPPPARRLPVDLDGRHLLPGGSTATTSRASPRPACRTRRGCRSTA